MPTINNNSIEYTSRPCQLAVASITTDQSNDVNHQRDQRELSTDNIKAGQRLRQQQTRRSTNNKPNQRVNRINVVAIHRGMTSTITTRCHNVTQQISVSATSMVSHQSVNRRNRPTTINTTTTSISSNNKIHRCHSVQRIQINGMVTKPSTKDHGHQSITHNSGQPSPSLVIKVKLQRSTDNPLNDVSAIDVNDSVRP